MGHHIQPNQGNGNGGSNVLGTTNCASASPPRNPNNVESQLCYQEDICSSRNVVGTPHSSGSSPHATESTLTISISNNNHNAYNAGNGMHNVINSSHYMGISEENNYISGNSQNVGGQHITVKPCHSLQFGDNKVKTYNTGPTAHLGSVGASQRNVESALHSLRIVDNSHSIRDNISLDVGSGVLNPDGSVRLLQNNKSGPYNEVNSNNAAKGSSLVNQHYEHENVEDNQQLGSLTKDTQIYQTIDGEHFSSGNVFGVPTTGNLRYSNDNVRVTESISHALKIDGETTTSTLGSITSAMPAYKMNIPNIVGCTTSRSNGNNQYLTEKRQQSDEVKSHTNGLEVKEHSEHSSFERILDCGSEELDAKCENGSDNCDGIFVHRKSGQPIPKISNIMRNQESSSKFVHCTNENDDILHRSRESSCLDVITNMSPVVSEALLHSSELKSVASVILTPKTLDHVMSHDMQGVRQTVSVTYSNTNEILYSNRDVTSSTSEDIGLTSLCSKIGDYKCLSEIDTRVRIKSEDGELTNRKHCIQEQNTYSISLESSNCMIGLARSSGNSITQLSGGTYKYGSMPDKNIIESATQITDDTHNEHPLHNQINSGSAQTPGNVEMKHNICKQEKTTTDFRSCMKGCGSRNFSDVDHERGSLNLENCNVASSNDVSSTSKWCEVSRSLATYGKDDVKPDLCRNPRHSDCRGERGISDGKNTLNTFSIYKIIYIFKVK